MFDRAVAAGPEGRAVSKNPQPPSDALATNKQSLKIIQDQQHDARAQQSSALPAVDLVDPAKLEKLAEAIRKTCARIGTDEVGLFELLKGVPRNELKDLDEVYKRKYGINLDQQLRKELSGAELEKGLSMLRPTNFDDAARIRVALIERDQVFTGRSNATCERDIRDTLATLNSKDIANLDKEYRSIYGMSLHDALIKNSTLPQTTKDSIEILLKGADGRSTQDTLKLADIALKAKNLDMWEETFRYASPEARKQFQDNGGYFRVATTFSGLDRTKAWEYVTRGDTSLATRVRDNTRWNGDNEEAIEKEIEKIGPFEREQYIVGERLARQHANPIKMSKAEFDALGLYTDTHNALQKAAGKWFAPDTQKTELARWEDQIRVPGGTLITELSKHCGVLWDDGAGKVITSIENMSQKDFDRLKTDPEFRENVYQVLESFLGGEDLRRVKSSLSSMMNLESLEEAQKYGRRPVTDAIKDANGLMGLDADKVVDAIKHMTPGEQEMYRTIPGFRQKIDMPIIFGMKPDRRDAALHMLDQVRRGEEPREDIVVKLLLEAGKFNTDETQVIKDLKDAFKEDPQLRERILHPKNADETRFSNEFNKAIHAALDPGEYEKYAKPLIETGRVSFKTQAELNKGFFDDDEYGVYEMVKNGSPDDWKELIDDPKRTLPFMSEKEREIALNIARQNGEMRPEDQLRAAMLGAGTDETKIKEVLQSLTPEQLAHVKEEFARKYHENLQGDVFAELGGNDKTEAARNLRETPATARDAYNNARDEIYESMDGVGRFWVRNFWDGTADITNEELNHMSAAMTDWARDYQQMPPEERQFFEKRIFEAVDQYRKSEEAAADMTVDAAIIIGGLAASGVTGGVSLTLLAKTAIIGAAFKIGTKAAIMGNDYDFQSSQSLVDGATGAVDALAMVVGPGQVAQWMGIGKGVATEATERLFAEGAENLLKQGVTKAQVGEKVFELVAKSIAQGNNAISPKVVERLAAELGKEGSEKALQGLLARHIQEAVISQSATFLKATLREAAINSAAGAIAGGGSGTVRGFAQWDSSKTFEQNMTMVGQSALLSASMAAAMAGTFTITFKTLGKAVQTLKDMTGHGAYLESGTEAVVNGNPLEANSMMTLGHGDIDGATDLISAKHLSVARDAQGNLLVMDHSAAGTWIKRAGSEEFEKIKFATPVEIHPGDQIRLGSPDGPQLKLGKILTADLNPFKIPGGDVTRLATNAGDMTFKPKTIDVNKDMTHLIEREDHKIIGFEQLKPGAETQQYKDYTDFKARAVTTVDKESRVYKLKGFDTEIIVPEDYARKLDEVRELRELARMDPMMHPDEADAIRRAQARLQSHPLRNRLLPEQMGQILEELPDRRTIKQLQLLEGSSPDDVWHSQTDGKPFTSAANADIAEGTVRFFTDHNTDVTKNVREVLTHEWAHTLEKSPAFEAFKVAADIEQGGFYAREYAKKNAHENWAVHLGENLLNEESSKVHVLAKQAPLRTVAMAEALEQTLAAVPQELRSPYHQQLLERLQLIGRDAVPEAKRILDDMMRSGDNTKINNALKFLEKLQISRPGAQFGASLFDSKAIVELARNATDDQVSFQAMRTLISLYENNPPQHVVNELIDISKGGNNRAGNAIATLTQVHSMDAQMYLVKNMGMDAIGVASSVSKFDATADKMMLLRVGMDRLDAPSRLQLVQSVMKNGTPEMQLAVLDEVAARGDHSVLPAVTATSLSTDAQVAAKAKIVAQELQKKGEDVITTMLNSGDTNQMKDALKLIYSMTERSETSPFTTSLADKTKLMQLANSRNKEIAEGAIYALREMYRTNPPDDVIDTFITLAEGRSQKADAARYALLQMSSVRAHVRLISTGKAELFESMMAISPNERMSVMRAAFPTMSPQARAAATRDILTTFNESTQTMVLSELGYFGDPSVIPVLEKFAQDGKASTDVLNQTRDIIKQLKLKAARGGRP